MSRNLKDNTVQGVNWSFLKVLTTNVSQFLVGIVLARLIAPDKFGLIGMAMIFISFGNIFSTFGIKQAIVQKKNLLKEDIATGVLLSLILGLLIYLITYFLAPLIALFFNEDIVTNLVRFLGLTFPVKGLTAVGLGLLMREFDFKKVFIVSFTSYIFGYGAVTVPLAFFDYGVWALAIGSLSQATLQTLIVLFITRNKVSIGFNLQSAKDLLFFGGGVSGVSIFNSISGKVDYLIVGRFMSANHVGLYTKAFNLMRVPLIAFSHVLGNVLLTSYSSMQDDKDLLRRSYYKSIEIINLLSFPLLTGMAISSYYIIVGLYGVEWVGAVQAFRILCFAAFFKVTLHSSGSVAKSQGYVYAEALRQMFYAIIITVGVLIGAQFNLITVSIAIVIGSLSFAIMMFRLCLDIVDGEWIDLLKASKGGIVLSIPVALSNFITIYIFDLYGAPYNYTIGLFILILVSAISLFMGVILIPSKYKGKGLKWIFNLYGKYLPDKINDIILGFL
ncbi:lipopolysaccharide biosynthesis protein [Halanaerobiaceae bacterium Z-7014]|uniref:Lipopolysaccharide biosynthesis protein n=1 Tax=Halonatronomonas betaini TaxID=2778430 RepID=A0A931AU47_9FIRM|nr:lipopolysaccharide biosynthesis protein [Halonatronomonas betaini]MBF8436520.1 lipopolysaccharide biosynthesis protein [Halonatronomonas betaini]